MKNATQIDLPRYLKTREHLAASYNSERQYPFLIPCCDPVLHVQPFQSGVNSVVSWHLVLRRLTVDSRQVTSQWNFQPFLLLWTWRIRRKSQILPMAMRSQLSGQDGKIWGGVRMEREGYELELRLLTSTAIEEWQKNLGCLAYRMEYATLFI